LRSRKNLLGLYTFRDVGEGDDGAAAVGHVDRHRDVGDGDHRIVPADEPIELARHCLARQARQQHGAVRRRESRAVRMSIVDRFVAWAVQQLADFVIAERRDGSGIRVPNQAVMIDDPDRLRDRLQHDAQELLDGDLPAT
jgi:hypothetical protein